MAYIAPTGLLIFRPSSDYIPPSTGFITFYPGSDLANCPEVPITLIPSLDSVHEIVVITSTVELNIEFEVGEPTVRTDIIIPLISVPFRVLVYPLDTILASELLEVALRVRFGIKIKLKLPVYNNLIYRIKLT